MDKDLQSAYSKQANVEVEQVLGASSTISIGYQYVPRREPADVDQPERGDLPGGRHEQRLPAGSTYMNNGQYQGAGESNYHGLHLMYVQRPTDWYAVRASYALSKSMNNLGEAFFSAPTDPTNVMKDWGRSDND